MIISHKHRFIFIKPQKTAGTSVELLLSRICGPDDVITPLGFDPDPNVREKHHAKPPQNYFRPKPLRHWQLNEIFWLVTKGRRPHLSYWEHLTANEIKQYVGEEVWNSYHKISVVRNPWDHAVSMYEWMATFGFGKVRKGDFTDFVHHRCKVMWPFFSTNDVYAIDTMLRFENLADDIIKLADVFPELKNYPLPVTKDKVRATSGYRERYSDEQREIIRLKNLNVIELFHYKY